MRHYSKAWGTGNRIYRGVLTGCNDAFVIDGATRQRLIDCDARSSELIKPLAVGDDVRKWHVRDKGRYLIVTHIGVEIQSYPAIFHHLSQWEDRLRRRSDQGNHWWELRSCDYYDVFDKPKIIYPDIALEPRFLLDTKCTFISNTTYFIPTDDYFLLGILNSSPMWEYCKRTLTVLGDVDKRGRLRFFTQDVMRLPIPLVTASEKQAIAEIAKECSQAEGVNCEIQQEQLNILVSRLFGF